MITPKLCYTPKGGMCATCVHKLDDCSVLKFDEMPPLGKGYSDGVVIVKCTEYKRVGK